MIGCLLSARAVGTCKHVLAGYFLCIFVFVPALGLVAEEVKEAPDSKEVAEEQVVAKVKELSRTAESCLGWLRFGRASMCRGRRCAM